MSCFSIFRFEFRAEDIPEAAASQTDTQQSQLDGRAGICQDWTGTVRQDLESTAQLFAAYADSLGLDLSFQEFDTELKSLPGKYAPPTGEILLARGSNGTVMGCVAVRPLFPPDHCEMKRLYVLPAGRGLGIGEKLVHQILDIAASLGYIEIRLDTLPSMIQAISLYESAGFAPTIPYYETILSGTVFLARKLQVSHASADSAGNTARLASADTARKT